jgi:DNA-binding transcriptional regulator YiaG
MRVVQVNFGEERYEHARLVMFVIREARRRLGLDRTALADLINQRRTRRRITAESVEGWELGRNVPPADVYLIVLDETGLNVAELIERWLKRVKTALMPIAVLTSTGDIITVLKMVTAPISPWW